MKVYRILERKYHDHSLYYPQFRHDIKGYNDGVLTTWNDFLRENESKSVVFYDLENAKTFIREQAYIEVLHEFDPFSE